MPRTAWVPLVLLAAAGCASPAETGSPDAEPETVTIRVAEARQAPLPDVYVATATLRGRSTAVLSSKAVGYIRTLAVQAGDTVEAGQVLVQLDVQGARAGVSEARAAVAEARAAAARADNDLAAAQADLRLAQLTWDRTSRLADQAVVSTHERDRAEAALSAANARVRVAEASRSAAVARIEQARAGADAASVQLGDRQIVAPFAGRIVSRSADVGDLASPGVPLLTLEARGSLRAEAVVDESQASRINLGDPAEVSIEAVDVTVEGHVGEVVPAVDVGSRAFVAKVDLPAEADTPELRPGMFARVRFRVGERERLVVPRSAVSVRGALERVFVVEDGRARMRLVTLGTGHEDLVEVLSGLSAGERVVDDPPATMVDATPVEIQP